MELRGQSQLPLFFVSLSLAPSGSVRSIFSCYLVQMSASVFCAPNCDLRLAVFVLFLESLKNRLDIVAVNFPQGRLRLMVLPWRAPRYDPFFMTKYSLDNESNFCLVNRLVFSVVNYHRCNTRLRLPNILNTKSTGSSKKYHIVRSTPRCPSCG